MNSIDIAKIKVDINISVVLNYIFNKIDFLIDIRGDIYINGETKNANAIIYSSTRNKIDLLSLDVNNTSLTISSLFKAYKPKVQKDICTLSPLMCWQDVIELNRTTMLYFDHQSDGVDLFEDKTLELMGWHCAALDITYRSIVEELELKAKGILVFYDNPMQFSGFSIIDDIEEVIVIAKEFILKQIDIKLANNEIDLEDEDSIEALEYFGVNKWKS